MVQLESFSGLQALSRSTGGRGHVLEAMQPNVFTIHLFYITMRDVYCENFVVGRGVAVKLSDFLNYVFSFFHSSIR